MASKTFFLKDVAVSGFGSLSETNPGASTTGTGWTVGKIASGNFSALLYGTERATGTFSTTDYLVTTHPNPGSGDSWRSENTMNGVFANANWVFTFPVRAVTAANAQRGRIKVRVWKSVNADGSSPTELTAATQTGTTITAISTSADNNSVVTWSPGGTVTLTAEYLFIQCEWEITTAGTTNTADILIRAGTSSTMVTSNFTPTLQPQGINYDLGNRPFPYLYSIGLRTWLQWQQLEDAAVAALPFNQYDWPLTRPYEYPYTRWWVDYASPVNQLAINYVTRAPLYTNPREYPYHVQLRTWFGRLPPPLQLPTGQIVTDLTQRPYEYHAQLRNWTWSYNLNLIGQDKLPTGEIITERPTLALTTAANWINSVNIALTSARRPFSQLDWPLTPAAARPTNLSTWVDQTKLLLAVPFSQSDWPINRGSLQPDRSYGYVFPRVLIGQDKLPVGTEITDLPPRAPQQPIPIFVASYNKNLIGQDQLPTGAKITDLTPQAPLSAIQLRTWIQAVNLALVAAASAKPFAQYDWPINTGPRQPTQVFTASYNRNLIGKDRLPFRQQDWPVPTPRPRAPDLTTWIDRAKSYLQRPHSQRDWPLPQRRQQPALSFTNSYNLNLIGKDRLPNRQQDWPLPRDARRLSAFLAPTNIALFYPPFTGQLPFNQYSWPLPGQPAPLWQRYSYEFQGGNLYPIYVSPIPPVPPPTPSTDSRIIHNPGNEWQYYDRIREPGPVGWR